MYQTANIFRVMQELLYSVPAVLIAISFHEFAHGYVSNRLGDPTPKMDGRLTLNPFRHLDPAGTLCLIFFHMGWAKPVRVNTRYYKNRRRDMTLVALAGPLSNFLLAFVSIFFYGLIIKITGGSTGRIVYYFTTLLYYIGVVNVGLGVFNLIPIPPLDGSAILSEIIGPKVDYYYGRVRRYAPVILLLLLATGVLSRPLMFFNGTILDIIWGIVKGVLRIGVGVSSGGAVA